MTAVAASAAAASPGTLLELKEALGVQPTPAMISVGCNRDPNAVDWLVDRSNTIVYGGGRLAAIYDVDNACVVATLRGHKQRVNAVKWIPQTRQGRRFDSERLLRVLTRVAAGDEVEVVTGSTDKTILVWRYNLSTHQVGLDPLVPNCALR